jgi:pSer/pThr/pTyr-binding forkhead associated (FHA) protein
MALFIRCVDGGPSQKQQYALSPGFVVGRSEGNLVVPQDGKLSSRHAYVELEEGALYLVDNKSKNGLRLAGYPAQRIKLIPGVVILMGSYTYEIIEIREPTVEEKKAQTRTWYEILARFLKKNLKEMPSKPNKKIVALHPAVVLDFVRGSQAETKWILGYGPRKIGPKSLDLPIFEPGAPDVCFEILPSEDGISFRTNHPEVVQLNGQRVKTGILHIADVIRINDTEIEVDFI